MSIYHFGAEWGEDRTRYSSKSKPRILIIGQAPPAREQEFPYCSTMLYDWLLAVGIGLADALEMFEFEAIYNKFPGYDKDGKAHKKPSIEQMEEHWPVLESKIQLADKVWLLGNASKEFFYSKPKTWSCSLQILETIHPSKLNLLKFRKNREKILSDIKNFIYDK